MFLNRDVITKTFSLSRTHSNRFVPSFTSSYYYYTPFEFFRSVKPKLIFHLSLSNIGHLSVSRTLLIIFDDLNYALVQIVSICLPIFNPYSPFSSAPITIGITVTLMFHNFLSLVARSKYLSRFSFYLILLRGPFGWLSPPYGKFSPFFSLLTRIRWSYVLQYPWELYMFHFPRRILFSVCTIW